MPLPIQTITILPMLGDEKSHGDLVMSEVFSPASAENTWINKYGRISRIGGYLRQNAVALVGATGGTTLACRSLIFYRKIGSSIVRDLLGFFHDGDNEINTRFSTDSGVTWTAMSAYLVSSGEAPYCIPDGANIGTVLYLTHPRRALTYLMKYDGGGNLLAISSSQLAAPTPSASTGPGTGLLAGTYRWKLVPVKDDGTRKAASLTSDIFVADDEPVELDWTADGDTTVVGYDIYRTTGRGVRFYFSRYSDGRTVVNAIDNTSDTELVGNATLVHHGDAPGSTSMTFVESHGQRLWYGGELINQPLPLGGYANPGRWYYSDPGQPESFNWDANFIDFTDDASLGDIPAGATGNFRNMFVAWYERSVWTLSGTGRMIGVIPDWDRKRANCQVGTVSHRTVVRVPIGAKYRDAHGNLKEIRDEMLAYFTPFGDVRLFDGDSDEIISSPEDPNPAMSGVQEGIAGSRLTYAHRMKAYAYVDTAHREIVWVYPFDGGTEPGMGLVWNYRWGTFHTRPDWNFGHGVEIDSSSVAQILVTGGSLIGHVYKQWTGDSADGNVMGANWLSKPIYGKNEDGTPDVAHMKRWRRMYFRFVHQTNIQGLAAIAHESEQGGLIYTKTISNRGRQKCVLTDPNGRYIHEPGLRIGVASALSSGTWELDSIQIEYQQLPGEQR